MNRKRILAVIAGRYYPEYNGQAKIFHESASRINRSKQAQIEVIRFRYDGKKIKNYIQDGISVKTINLPIQPKGIGLLLGLVITGIYFYFHFRKIHKEFEIVHGITVTWTTIICLNIAKLFSKKTILESSALGDVISPIGNIPKFIYDLKEYFKYFLIKRIDKVKVYSKAQLSEIEKIDYKNKVYKIQPSIDTDNHRPVSIYEKNKLRKKYNINEDTKVISFVGNVCFRKGFDLLLEAFFILRKKNLDTLLFAAGPVDDEFIHYTEKKIDNIYFTNANIKNVHEVIQMSDVLVLPSRNEAFGMVIGEAMASKIPVVVSKIDGVTDHILGDERGILVDYNPSKIASGIEKALKPGNDKMILRAYNYILENCSKSKVDDQYFKLWFL